MEVLRKLVFIFSLLALFNTCIIKFFHERYFCNWEYDSTGKCWSKKKKKKTKKEYEVEEIKEKLKGTNEHSCSH